MHVSTQLMHKTAQAVMTIQLAGVVEITRDVQMHQHPILELVYYLEGNVQCCINNETFECHPGMLRLMPPRVIHGEIVPERFTCLYIWLAAPLYPHWPQVYIDDAGQTIRNLCMAIVNEWNGQAPHREAMVNALLGQLDVLLQRANDQPIVSTGEQLVQDGERLLKEQFATPTSIGKVAATLGVSPSHLRTQFIHLRGQTPMAYLQGLRVEHALALIQNSDLSLEAIAHLCGYDSSSHLSRHVKRATGLRPGAFRN